MLADAIAQALPGLRAEAESLMTSTCRIFHRGEPLTDPETGEVTATDGDPIYDGPCRVRPAGPNAATADVGGVEVARFDYIVSVPFSATGITTADQLSITASPDPSLVGVELEVQKPFGGDYVTARRLACTEVL